MRAVVLTGTIENPHVEVANVDAPVDAPGHMVVEVAAAGISTMEPRWITLWQNADGTPRQRPVVLGLEFAGCIRSLGPGVEGFAVGQNVMGMTNAYRNGAMAELVSAEAAYVLAMPDGLSYDEAATLPLSGQTAWQALVRYGELRRGQRVLIHGGAGAVGRFAIQIAGWIGAYIVATASAADEDLCRSLGADQFIDYKREHFEDRGDNYDLVFDQIGGDVRERSWAVLKRGGRLVTIAGEESDAPDQKRAREMGVTALFFIVDQNIDDLRELTNLVVAGSVHAIIGRRFQLAEAATAFAGSNRSAGKAVLICSDRLRQEQLCVSG